MSKKPTVVCLMGPTASGKTALACEWVLQNNMEIVSVDSTLIYREMNIGTAKPDAQILQQAPHHLIDLINPNESYSVAQFCHDAQFWCDDILARGKTPLLVGGTMMYFNALQRGLTKLPSANAEVRKMIVQEAENHGWDHLYQQLVKIDPRSAQRIHAHDLQRLQRALEVYRVTGRPLSEWLETQEFSTPYNFVNIALMPKSRAWLHENIAARFRTMLDNGLISEVEALICKWSLNNNHPALRSVGYRQVFDYLQGLFSKDELFERGVAATRQLAKRQLTWLRGWDLNQKNIF